MFSIKVIRVTPLDNLRLLILFENGVQKIFDVNELIKEVPAFELLRDPALFQQVKVEPGGYGVRAMGKGSLHNRGTEGIITLASLDEGISYLHRAIFS